MEENKKTEKYRAIGLMSGTSMDGLDICYAEFFRKDGHWSFSIIHAETLKYPTEWEKTLKNAVHFSAEKLLEIHSKYGEFLGEAAHSFVEKHSLGNIHCIGSHGHTVFHQPEKKFTLQIGDGRAICIKNNIPTVYDFRMQDVLLGGNGAPLVPIGDRLLFSEFESCLNLGGFSNISFEKEGKRIAFDICPVNFVLNYFSQKLGEKFDENGDFARNGEVYYSTLEQLNSLEFYLRNHPKSLGAEWTKREVLPILNKLKPEDALATFTVHAAEQIARTIKQENLKNVLITGGGAYNSFLIEKIRVKTSAEIIIPDEKTVEYKEALIFALLAVLRMNSEVNVLCSATGAKYDHCSGTVSNY